MSYASCSENNSEQVNDKLWNPYRPISQVKDGSTTARKVSIAQREGLTTLPRDLTRRLDEPVDRPLEDPRFRDKLFPLSLNEGPARETRNEERLKATIKDLRRDLKRANRQAKQRDQLLREFKDRVAGLESTNKRLEELYACAQVLISELKATLTQRDSENRSLRQENDTLCFKEEMRDVQPLRHSA